jgi:hypothetical protein
MVAGNDRFYEHHSLPPHIDSQLLVLLRADGSGTEELQLPDAFQETEPRGDEVM